jgi:hypothetical protein
MPGSYLKATLAATSVTGVPWRRRTMDSWELAFGSNAGLIPSEVAARTLLTRASMYGSQIRWSIPRSASMVMISAISEMIWEDVFCQSKRLMTNCMGQENMWDFLIKIRNLCPQQTNILWVGCLYILPLIAWQSTKVVPFVKLITNANNISTSSKHRNISIKN